MCFKRMRRLNPALLLAGLLPLGSAQAEFGLNFPPPAGDVAQDIYDIHMLTMQIATVLLIIVFCIVFYSLYHHRKSRGYQADQNFHNTWFGHWSWVIVPVLVLGVDFTIANNANQVLKTVWEVPEEKDIMDLKVTGHQWWWEFDYLDHDVKVESRALPQDKAGDLYLRDVDNRLVLPVGQKIRFLHTSADVLHAFWVPELAFKKDAIPGYVTETWIELNREGVFRGQCAELCGTWHSRMPIVVEAVSREKFDQWVSDQNAIKVAAVAEASSDKSWSKDELMEKGKSLYETKCAACHQITGTGLPPAFPPLKGSPIATGPIGGHLQIVLNGKAGTAMQAWNSLNDLEIAAIITYERNAWGNDTGDIIQPADVKNAR
ncbi:MAG: cytochrome c oxidase subunit II [Gammaproteobacteria bacterium]|nr:cytochrome c oxidase subunit II [Gammaproteobacteria bacterium]